MEREKLPTKMVRGMTPGLKILYIGAAILAMFAILLGSYDFFVVAGEERSLISDVLIPLGAFVVIVFLYRRRKADLQGDSPLR